LLTPNGERRIEELKIGDFMTTLGGGAKPIEWIARRVYRRSADRGCVASVKPVLIARGALGPNMPHSDLWVSQQHSIGRRLADPGH
jgi:Hint domain